MARAQTLLHRPMLDRAPLELPPRELPALDRAALAGRILEAEAITPLALSPAGPYVDYARILTPQGGILITYKDLDLRLRCFLWSALAWSGSTLGESLLLFNPSPVDSSVVNFLCLLLAAILNWFIVNKPVEMYRAIEIRPDCLILEGKDVFWLSHMQSGLPAFQPDEENNLILSGIYGSRFVEYLTIRRFDELDRTPEVFAGHLEDAMKQLWQNGLTK